MEKNSVVKKRKEKCYLKSVAKNKLFLFFVVVIEFKLYCGFDLAKTFVDVLKNSKLTSLENELKRKFFKH